VNISTLWKHRLLFAALYFSEGAPIGFLWWALPAQLRLEGVPIEQITLLTSVLVLPWTLKFLWAPLIDLLTDARWTLKHWILSAQALMAACLAPLLFVNISTAFAIVVAFLLLHAVAAATQDVAIDALAIRTVPSGERGRINGWMQAGMLLGRSLFGGVSLIILTRLDHKVVILCLMLAILSSAILLLQLRLAPQGVSRTQDRKERFNEFFSRLRSVATARSTWLGFLVALMAGAAFEGTGAVAGPFLVDRGFAAESVGTFFGIHVIVAMMSGSLLGGLVADKLSKPAAVSAFLSLIAGIVVAIGLVDLYYGGRGNDLMLLLLTLLYFGIGLFTAASYAFFMDITEPRLAATQFSAFMGATNLCESWSAFTIGRMIALFGYPAAFIGISVLSLAALPALAAFKRSSPSASA
jgi:predicted MFS family arabinose efflux permease